MAADPVAARLIDLSQTAESESVALGACNSVLDRVGIKSKTEAEIGVKPWEEILYDGFSGISGGSREESRARRGFNSETVAPEGYSIEEASHAGLPSEEPLRTIQGEDLSDGGRIYRTRHYVEEQAFEHVARLRHIE